MTDQSSTFPVTAGDINIYHARSIADQQVTYVVECAGRLDIDRVQCSLTECVQPFIRRFMTSLLSHLKELYKESQT